MERGRAFRRGQAARAVARSVRTWREIDAQDGADSGRASDPVFVGRRAATRTFATSVDRSGLGERGRIRADITAAEQGVN